MKKTFWPLTDWVATKKGTWIVLAFWLIAIVLLSILAPSANDYKSNSFDSLPKDAASIEAAKKVEEYFPDDGGVPAIIVFNSEEGKVEAEGISKALTAIEKEVDGLTSTVPFAQLPPPTKAEFLSEDGSAAAIPFVFQEGFDSSDFEPRIDAMTSIAIQESGQEVYITGPAGIATDTTALFSRADVVLILSTVGLILILLIIIYRSPLLAVIPLLASGFVYAVTDRILGLYGAAGLEMSSQSLSIMTILLFAAVTDYSLFVLARFREELKHHESKYDAMKYAMRETGEPVFFSGGTVLAAMLMLFFAAIRDYQSFAPLFATAMGVIMIASITLVPALFTLFGRGSFWPKVPKVGVETEKENGLWHRIARFVTNKPALSGGIVLLFLMISSLNVFNVKYEFDTLKSFPDDMPSLIGYNIIDEKFAVGDLSPTTVIVEGTGNADVVTDVLTQQDGVQSAKLVASTGAGDAHEITIAFETNPYDAASLDTLADLRANEAEILEVAGGEGDLYFAGETAEKLDDRELNNRDLLVIVSIEIVLLFVMLIVLTRSWKMPLYMVGTIVLSFLSALGLGLFLVDLLFGIGAISTRVPLYSFVFLVALGVDYNIILVSRYMEEREKHPLKKAVEIAVAKTGGVISSAGIILAATFAVLMTQPIEILFVFGFIVAVGILLDTFFVRGLLLPAFILFFERKK
ncbi:MMPL domain-containing protein [Domibacillus aminovorans]|uniref:MMPL domain-containing protein n=1 Tax=Domibacillus aminovorans TaxID=29332 RepID=A0A177KJS6_9BACI|nr:MMPL family transporter [Domibacillus aminovorans]OAH53145.1 MMPL domain-containing protein [Domibacillus aminovorans]